MNTYNIYNILLLRSPNMTTCHVTSVAINLPWIVLLDNARSTDSCNIRQKPFDSTGLLTLSYIAYTILGYTNNSVVGEHVPAWYNGTWCMSYPVHHRLVSTSIRHSSAIQQKTIRRRPHSSGGQTIKFSTSQT